MNIIHSRQGQKTSRLLITLWLPCALCAALLFLPIFTIAGPEDEQPLPGVEMAAPEAEKPAIYDEMKETIGKSQAEVLENIKLYQEILKTIKGLETSFQSELNAFRLQLAAYEQVLLLEETPINELQKVYAGKKIATYNIASRLKDLRIGLGKYTTVKKQTEEHLKRWKEQRETLAKQVREGVATTPPPLDKLDALLEKLASLEALLREAELLYQKRITALEEISADFSSFAQRLDERAARKKNLDIFEKTPGFWDSVRFQTLFADLRTLAQKATHPFSSRYWSQTSLAGKQYAAPAVLVFVFLLCAVYLISRRILGVLVSQESLINRETQKWSWTGLCLVKQSVTWVFFILFLYGYEKLQVSWPSITSLRAFNAALMAWLVTGWTICLTRMAPELLSLSIPFDKFAKMAKTLRFLIIVYAIFWWGGGAESSLSLVSRVFLSLVLMAWAGLFWRWTVRTEGVNAITKVMSLVGLAVALVALVADFRAYGLFSQYWLASWGQTMWVLLGAGVSFEVLREWRQQIQKQEESLQDDPGKESRPMRWLTMRMGFLGWFLAACSLLFVAWDIDSKAFAVIFDVMGYQAAIGSLHISLLGVLYASLALWCTHAFARVFSNVFRYRFLADSGLEPGFQESLTTLASYLIWAFGILFSLSLLGVSGTSLAVVFGALGIGLGFGLQAIFNNFMSGLILLFERPIQVGDILEVNGTWGEVKKINVRSTVVQTYDNASLIIPNSEMISNQVTNWSFKDPKLRRNLYVGVAYGSDITLVRDTLQEVADKHPRVYRRPKPDVLFTDFGDSALMFRLRFWSHVDYFLVVETELRFEIDRLFKERNINIPFPQRDLHLRTVPAVTFREAADAPPSTALQEKPDDGPSQEVPDKPDKP